MNKKHIVSLLVLLVSSASMAQPLERNEPVNAPKLSLGIKVQVPEGVGLSVGMDSPVGHYLSLGGEASINFNLPRGEERFYEVLRLNVVAKPRLVYNDHLETYVKAQVGPAFKFSYNEVASLGLDVAVLPGFQFSMSDNVGMFSEIGFGLTYFPRSQETIYAGIFRSGVFFSF